MAAYKTLKDLEEEKMPRAGQAGTALQQAQAVPKASDGASGMVPGTLRQEGVGARGGPEGQQLLQSPGIYSSMYRDQLEAMADKILNQGAFSYDVNADALYQQMVDQYAQQGRLAMMDTMGHAQTMTGGYGNSYAQGAGQQAYQGYLRQANEQLPQFYAMALDRYDREQDALRDQYAMLLGQEEQDYGRYRDQLSDYYARLDRLQNQYNADRDYEYRKDRDEIADKQWQAEMDESIRQFNHIHGIGQETEGGGSSDGYGDYERWLEWLWQQEVGDAAAPLLDASVSGGLNAAGSSDLLNAAGVFTAQDGPGIDTAVQTGSMKGSTWDYVKHNLSELVDTGNLGTAKQYMGQVVGQMSDSQYKEALAILGIK